MMDSEEPVATPTPSGSPHPVGVPPPRQGYIFDIKRYAINDGPGIRITFFFKGCNLNCTWCHNPEGISPYNEKMYNISRCIGCGICVTVCPEAALEMSGQGVITDHARCSLCGKCADACPAKAFEMTGKQMTSLEIIETIEKERVFIEQSGGGVTFSGGEPLLQPGFLLELLKACGKRGIHRAVDTAGFASQDVLAEVARYTDLFLFDLKMIDPGLHKRWTGVTNARILENLVLLSETGKDIIIRIPLIAGVNDNRENIIATAEFLRQLPNPVVGVHLLPYHAIAQSKFTRLGKATDFVAFEEPSGRIVNEIIMVMENVGLKVQVGG